MAGLLENKVALVVGAGRHPGLGIAQRYAREGAKLLLIDRDAESLKAQADALAASVFVAAPDDKSS